jgi:hypothetical protein
MAEQRPQSPGLKWRRRATGPDVPGWYASEAAIKAGYPVKYADLKRHIDHPVLLIERARRLQAEMLLWMSGQHQSTAEFDGTFKWLLENYQKDPESPFNTTLGESGVSLYTTYLKKLIPHIGPRRIDQCDGRDVMRWFAQWRIASDGSARDQLSVARVCLAIIKAAVSFGVVCRAKGCAEFQIIMKQLEFETTKGRTQAPTADQVVAARAAAHAAGAPLRALAYAIQFETTLRAWDVIGKWIRMSDPKPSAVLHNGKKWVGLTWTSIDNNLILAKVKPTKTEETTEVEVSFDLAACPMVVAELALIPQDSRTGPLIVNPRTGLPYMREAWRQGWRADYKAAGIPVDIWNRDMRAGGITEGQRAKVPRPDRTLLAGHASEATTKGYERDRDSKVEDMLEAHRRVMGPRVASRKKDD